MIILLKIRKSLFLFLNEDYRHGKKRRGWRTMSTETFENCGNVWYLEEYLLLFCRKTLYIEKNIKYIWIMNNDFHNIFKFLVQFDISFCRNLNF